MRRPGAGDGGGDGAGAWVSRASPSSFLLNGLAYGAGRFVAAGFGNALLTSTDGLSWTRRTWAPSIEGDTAVDFARDGGKPAVVGLNGSVASSSNEGLSWSNETQSLVTSFTGVGGNTGTRVAVGRDGSFNGVIVVDSGSAWVKASGVSEFVPQDVTWTGSQFIAVGGSFAGCGANAVVMTSPDGLAWTRLAQPTDVAPAGFALRAVTASAACSTPVATTAARSM